MTWGSQSRKVTRQYRVTIHETREIWLVNSVAYREANGDVHSYDGGAASILGLRPIADCEVEMVPVKQQVALPFDEIPLRIRKPLRATA